MTTPVQQSGTITPRHVAVWTTDGVIEDGGTAADGGVPTSFGVTGLGPALSVASEPVAGGNYNFLTLSADTDGQAQLVVQNFGTQPALSFNIIVNGQPWVPPSGGAGNVVQLECGQNAIAGTPVYSSSANTFSTAQGDALSTASVIGLTVAACSTGDLVLLTVVGGVSLATAAWDGITGGSGGLVAGSSYFLSPTTPGRLTTTVPTTPGQCVVRIGEALSTTLMLLNISPPILL